MMLLSLSGDSAMISDAAATIIQKIADSKTAMVFTIEDYLYFTNKTTLTTVVFYIPII